MKALATLALTISALHTAQAQAPPDWRAIILERAKTLASFPGQRVPEVNQKLLGQADEIAGGTVFFYDRTPVKVGLHGIDWTGSHIKHQEWPAQLNRFFHLQALAAAYRSTHDERYARAARSYIEDWIAGDNYSAKSALRPGDSTLNMSIRLGTSVHSGWGGTLPAFLDSPAFDDQFLAKVMDSIARQADFLAAHLTATGNWRISELDALVFSALRFPFLPNAGRILKTGATGMRNALATQFLPDGVHVERTPSYHAWMATVLANYFQVHSLFPDVDAGVKPDILVRALDYAAQTDLFGVNDSIAPHRDPEELPGLKARSEALRGLGLEKSYPALPPLFQIFPSAGQVFIRSGWKPGADYLAFDASTWGGGHSHLSRLSFVFRSKGRMLVADPGILNYEMSDPMGPYGKSTPAHTTLNLDGANQSGADAQLLHAESNQDVALIQARYQGGYWDGTYKWNFGEGRGGGVYGDHERVLLWVKGEYLLVIDSVSADPGAQVHNVWQLGPMDRWEYLPDAFSWWSKNTDVNLALQLLLPPAEAGMQTFSGSRDPIRGWVGVHGNDAVPAPLIDFSYPVHSTRPVVSAVLLTPYSTGTRPFYRFVSDENRNSAIHHLEIITPDGSLDRIAWSNGLTLPVDDAKPFTTDATFVWSRTNQSGAPVKSFLLLGSYLERTR